MKLLAAHGDCSFCGLIPSVVIPRSEATRHLSSSRLKEQENSRCMRYVQPRAIRALPASTLSHKLSSIFAAWDGRHDLPHPMQE